MVHCYRLHVATGIKTLKPVSDSSYLLIYMYMYVIIYLAISEFITSSCSHDFNHSFKTLERIEFNVLDRETVSDNCFEFIAEQQLQL